MWTTVVTSTQDWGWNDSRMTSSWSRSNTWCISISASPTDPVGSQTQSPDPYRWEVALGSSIAFIVLSRKHHLPAHIPPDWKGITPSFSSLPASSAMLSTQQIPFLGTACLKGGPRPARQAHDLAAVAYEEQRQCSKAPGRILQEKTHNSPLGCRIKSWDF